MGKKPLRMTTALRKAVKEAVGAKVEAAREAVQAGTADPKTVEDAMRQYEALSKRPCVKGAKCVYAVDGRPRSFTPAITVSGMSSELHCSGECAAIGLGIVTVAKQQLPAGRGAPLFEGLAGRAGRPATYLGGARSPKLAAAGAGPGDAVEVLGESDGGKYVQIRTVGGVVATVAARFVAMPRWANGAAGKGDA